MCTGWIEVAEDKGQSLNPVNFGTKTQRHLSVFKGFNLCSRRHYNITEGSVMKLKAIKNLRYN